MRNCEMQSLATGLLPVVVFLACTAGCGTRPSTKPNGLLTEPPAIDTTTLDAPVREAIEAARAGVRAEPQSAAKWGELGKLLHAHEAAAETSIDCLAQAERRQSNWPEWPYLQGVWLARDDPDRAIAKLRRAVELGGDEELTARMRLAETLAAEEQFAAARREADYVLSRSPASARARLLIGRLSLSEGKLREAREALEKVQNDPIARLAAMAMLAQVQQRLGEAAPISQPSAGTGRVVGWPDKFVDDVTAMRRGRRAELAVADGLLARNRPAEALAAAKATIDRYPDFAWAWLLSGRRAFAAQRAATGGEGAATVNRVVARIGGVAFLSWGGAGGPRTDARRGGVVSPGGGNHARLRAGPLLFGRMSHQTGRDRRGARIAAAGGRGQTGLRSGSRGAGAVITDARRSWGSAGARPSGDRGRAG